MYRRLLTNLKRIISTGIIGDRLWRRRRPRRYSTLGIA